MVSFNYEEDVQHNIQKLKKELNKFEFIQTKQDFDEIQFNLVKLFLKLSHGYDLDSTEIIELNQRLLTSTILSEFYTEDMIGKYIEDSIKKYVLDCDSTEIQRNVHIGYINDMCNMFPNYRFLLGTYRKEYDVEIVNRLQESYIRYLLDNSENNLNLNLKAIFEKEETTKDKLLKLQSEKLDDLIEKYKNVSNEEDLLRKLISRMFD